MNFWKHKQVQDNLQCGQEVEGLEDEVVALDEDEDLLDEELFENFGEDTSERVTLGKRNIAGPYTISPTVVSILHSRPLYVTKMESMLQEYSESDPKMLLKTQHGGAHWPVASTCIELTRQLSKSGRYSVKVSRPVDSKNSLKIQESLTPTHSIHSPQQPSMKDLSHRLMTKHL